MAKKLTFNKKSTVKGENKQEVRKFKFPSISRFIPDKNNEIYLFILTLSFILTSTFIIGFDLYRNINLEKKLMGQSSEIQKRISFWENEVRLRPDFRDAYFNLALIEYELKDFNSSKENLEKALSIDPNFEKGRKLEEILLKGL